MCIQVYTLVSRIIALKPKLVVTRAHVDFHEANQYTLKTFEHADTMATGL